MSYDPSLFLFIMHELGRQLLLHDELQMGLLVAELHS